MSQAYFQEDEILGKVYDARLVKRMWPFVTPYTGILCASIALVFTGMALFLVNPYLLGRIVDKGLKAGDYRIVVLLASLYGGIEIGVFLVGASQRYILQYLGQKIMFDLRNALFTHLTRMPVSFFDKSPVGRLVTRLTNDVNTLSELFSSGIVMALSDCSLIFGISVMLLALHPILGLATLAMMPLLGGTAWFFKSRMRGAFRLVRERIAAVNATLAEQISGMKIIQIFSRESERASKFDSLNASHMDAQLLSVFYHSFFIPVITIINTLSLCVIILLGGYLVMIGSLSLGLLVTFIAYAQHFFHPIRNLSEKITIFQSAMASAERLFGLFDELEEPPEAESTDIVNVEGKILFDSVSFSYDGANDVLKNVSFEITPGQTVAIVGHTGAGKTTVTALLNRFYDIERGKIELDGIELKRISRHFLRRNLAVIQQDVFIFAASVFENIRLWNENITREQVQAIAEKTGAHNFIKDLTGAYDFELHERGANISTGQRQLLAFTRALAVDPKILILDEATSSVDSETEKIIQEAVKTLTKGRTSLIVAHRLSTIRNCDRILVFHKGRLMEEGTHNELLASRGYYYKLHELQFSD